MFFPSGAPQPAGCRARRQKRIQGRGPEKRVEQPWQDADGRPPSLHPVAARRPVAANRGKNGTQRGTKQAALWHSIAKNWPRRRRLWASAPAKTGPIGPPASGLARESRAAPPRVCAPAALDV
ncbi:hypothetical protein TcCL_NonESM03478 [Trypanosoma cruzi]|nr:hypothetical protein TcCL_NonESM03478 [Trypanosoma cruzi]